MALFFICLNFLIFLSSAEEDCIAYDDVVVGDTKDSLLCFNDCFFRGGGDDLGNNLFVAPVFCNHNALGDAQTC